MTYNALVYTYERRAAIAEKRAEDYERMADDACDPIYAEVFVWASHRHAWEAANYRAKAERARREAQETLRY